MTVGGALRAGMRRVARAPAIVAGVWLSTLVLAGPLALALRSELAEHLGSSLAAETAASGVNHDWWNEFLAQTAGLGQTFVPSIIGFAAVLANLSSIADAQPPPSVAIASVIGWHLLLSVFVTGGVLDRLARDRRVGAYAFFAACGQHFFRLLRLAIGAAALYLLLFLALHPWLFGSVYPTLIRDVTVERTAIVYRVLLYLLFGVLVAAVNLVIDYAKIRMVVEDRRSAIGAVNGALRFLARNAGAATSLYLINLSVFAGVLALYALLAPGGAGGSIAWIGFVVGQIYIVLRIAVRLLFAASGIALFQGRLAHAGYVAAPLPKWPDSPAAEAVIPR